MAYHTSDAFADLAPQVRYQQQRAGDLVWHGVYFGKTFIGNVIREGKKKQWTASSDFVEDWEQRRSMREAVSCLLHAFQERLLSVDMRALLVASRGAGR